MNFIFEARLSLQDFRFGWENINVMCSTKQSAMKEKEKLVASVSKKKYPWAIAYKASIYKRRLVK